MEVFAIDPNVGRVSGIITDMKFPWHAAFYYLYGMTAIYLAAANLFWMAFFTVLPAQWYSDDSFRCGLFNVLGLISVFVAVLSVTSSAVIWRASSATVRALFVTTDSMFAALCFVN